MSSHRFRIQEKAALQFNVRYTGGKTFITKPIYYVTRGVKISVTLSADAVDVGYDQDIE